MSADKGRNRENEGHDGDEDDTVQDINLSLQPGTGRTSSNDSQRSTNGLGPDHRKGTDKESRHLAKPLPRLSTSISNGFTINDAPSSSVLPKAPTYSNVGSSFVDTMTQQLSIHVEQPVGSMSISPSSRDVVLAA